MCIDMQKYKNTYEIIFKINDLGNEYWWSDLFWWDNAHQEIPIKIYESIKDPDDCEQIMETHNWIN